MDKNVGSVISLISSEPINSDMFLRYYLFAKNLDFMFRNGLEVGQLLYLSVENCYVLVVKDAHH